MKTWHLERLFHAVVLLSAAAIQHRADLAAGSWRSIWPTVVFIGSLSAFAGVASITDRLRERLDLEGVQLPTVECAAKLPRYLTAGRVLMAVFFLTVGAWVSLASIAWDVLYPLWRRFYRSLFPASL